MMQTIHDMKAKTKGTNIDIVNFNYARVVFEDDEVDHINDENNIVKKLVKTINEKTQEYKETMGIEFKAKESGRGKVVLITGIGNVCQQYPSTIDDLLKIQKKMLKNAEEENEPLIQRVSSMPEFVPKSKPVSKPKPEPREIEPETRGKGVDFEKLLEKSRRQESKQPVTDTDDNTAVKVLLEKNNNLMNLNDIVDELAELKNIDVKNARQIIDNVASNDNKIEIDGDIIWLDN